MLKVTEALASDVLAFLKLQCLAPTPQNYTLAYLARGGSHPALGRAVDAVTDGGVRMTQDEADEILALHLDAGSAAWTGQAEDDSREAVRHQTLRLAEITASAVAATGDFNRDLNAEFDQLDGGSANVATMVAAMIERSRLAERELAVTAREVETLRQELDSARHDAAMDVLTGVGNRRAIHAHLEQLADTPRLLAICDVDHFKAINDRYGHAVGDRVLKAIAGALSAACAPHMVGRWGGEEFLVVMPAIEPDEGVAILDAARRQIAARHFRLRETDEPMGPVTFSAGVCLVQGGARENASALGRADVLLYRAKAEGRDRIVFG